MILGRTNREYPREWIRPVFGGDLEDLLSHLHGYRSVIDATAMPAVVSRLEKPRMLLIRGGWSIENAQSASHAADLMSAELIEALSSTLETSLEFFILRVRQPLEDHQIDGALMALSSAREEGLIRFVGLAVESAAAFPIWQLNDAFDIVLVPPDGDFFVESNKLAVARRVGLVVDGIPQDAETTHIRTYANRP
jgi:hypothetical protein